MKYFAILFFSTVAFATPVPLSHVGIEVDVTAAGALSGTGRLVLKQPHRTNEISSALQYELHCVLPIKVATTRGKIALDPKSTGNAPTDYVTSYWTFEFFSKIADQIAYFTKGTIEDLVGDFDGSWIDNSTYFVNGKGAAFAVPTKHATSPRPRLSLTLIQTESRDVLCEEIRKNAFAVKR